MVFFPSHRDTEASLHLTELGYCAGFISGGTHPSGQKHHSLISQKSPGVFFFFFTKLRLVESETVVGNGKQEEAAALGGHRCQGCEFQSYENSRLDANLCLRGSYCRSFGVRRVRSCHRGGLCSSVEPVVMATLQETTAIVTNTHLTPVMLTTMEGMFFCCDSCGRAPGVQPPADRDSVRGRRRELLSDFLAAGVCRAGILKLFNNPRVLRAG